VKEFLAFVEVRGWPVEAARVYGEIRAALEVKGRSIGAMDLLIAAHAIHDRSTLVTRNRTSSRGSPASKSHPGNSLRREMRHQLHISDS